MLRAFRQSSKLAFLRRNILKPQVFHECSRQPCGCVTTLRELHKQKKTAEYKALKDQYRACFESCGRWRPVN